MRDTLLARDDPNLKDDIYRFNIFFFFFFLNLYQQEMRGQRKIAKETRAFV